MEQEILAFVHLQFAAAIGRSAIEPATPLFSSGVIDSFGVLEVIAFLEDRFNIRINHARHDIRDFDTVDKMAGLVRALRANAV